MLFGYSVAGMIMLSTSANSAQYHAITPYAKEIPSTIPGRRSTWLEDKHNLLLYAPGRVRRLEICHAAENTVLIAVKFLRRTLLGNLAVF